jgi:hypothetical protein
VITLLTRFANLVSRVHVRLTGKYAGLFLATSVCVIGILIVPAFLPDETVERSFHERFDRLMKDVPPADCVSSVIELQLSPFVMADVKCDLNVDAEGHGHPYPVFVGKRANFQNILITALVAAFISMTIHLLSRSGSNVVTADSAIPKQETKDSFEMCISETTVEEALLIETKNAWLAARQFYGNSIYLLVSGVSTAVVSAIVFYFSIKDVPLATKDDIWPYLLSIIRPLGMLIFIEAIAWFLLRQYRSAIEDYKAFHRIYLRRSNYFIARRALSEIFSFEKSRKLAERLLSEDLSGRLSAGQTTEAIEAMKMDENNPVFKVLTDALASISGKGKEEKGKKSDEKPKDQKSE